MHNSLRLIGLAAVAAASVVVSASCTNDNASLQQSYEQAYGANRSSSGLLDGATSTLSGVVTTTTDAVTGSVENVTDPLLGVVDAAVTPVVLLAGNLATFTAPSELAEARFVYGSGDVESRSLSGLQATVSYRPKGLSCIEVTLKDGGKWFFDYAGKPLPEGYKPTISISLQSGKATVTSSDAVDEVLFFYSDGTKSNGTPDRGGRVSYTTGKTISYMSVRCKYDANSKWYFDRSGQPLPGGYRPSLSFTWKNNSVSVSSSDVFDQLVIRYSDGTKSSWSSSSFSGTFKPFQGREVAELWVRLKSDGSKWFFDNAGLPLDPCNSKWYTDLD